ncbi:MAG: hypothetical protein KIT81_13110 [Alphaproteobacteria bacterium]|nr:hypothetical protein [Alphaproteobacteria bacterium]
MNVPAIAKPAAWWPEASHAHESRCEVEDCPDPKSYFLAVLDVVNPLHHVPLIGNIYRHFSGDQISPVARVLGGGLYLGVGGVISGVVNAAVETIAGKDIGGTALAWFFGKPGEGQAPPTALAALPDAAAPAAGPAGASEAPPTLTEVPVSETTQNAMLAQLSDMALAQASAAPKPLAEAAPLPPAPPASVADGRRFFPIDRTRMTFGGEPRPLAPPPPGPAGMPLRFQAGEAAGAYGRALELSRTLREHYQPAAMTQQPPPPAR